jgi:hypothetical protein
MLSSYEATSDFLACAVAFALARPILGVAKRGLVVPTDDGTFRNAERSEKK